MFTGRSATGRIAILATIMGAFTLGAGQLRKIDGKLYDFTQVIRAKDPRYLIAGRIEEVTSTGAFVRVPVESRDKKVSGGRLLENWTERREIDPDSPPQTRRIFVQDLPKPATNKVIAIYAMPSGWHTSTNLQGVVEHVWKYNHGVPFNGDITQYDTIHILQGGTVSKKSLRPRTPASNDSTLSRSANEPAPPAGEQPR